MYAELCFLQPQRVWFIQRNNFDRMTQPDERMTQRYHRARDAARARIQRLDQLQDFQRRVDWGAHACGVLANAFCIRELFENARLRRE